MERIFTIVGLFFILLTTLSCTYTEKIRDGKTAFERKRYFQAAEMLEEEFKFARSNIERGDIAYHIGESCLKFGAHLRAGEWFKTAYEAGYGPSSLIQYARCLKSLERYDEAAEKFQQASLELDDPIRLRKEISICLQSMDWKEQSKYSPYRVQHLEINSENSDYAAQSIGESQIIFSSDRKTSTGDKLYAWTGVNFSDIFHADLANGQITLYDPAISTDDNEGTAVFDSAMQVMIFCRCFSRQDYDSNCKLMISERSGGSSWEKPNVIEFVRDGFNYRQPTLSQDGLSLIFSANLEEETRGYDLYFSQREGKAWSEPTPISDRINSEFDEMFPFILEDTLYFASDFGGMGGLDIYKSYIMQDGRWSPPFNLMAPINSGADDFAFVVNPFISGTDSIVESGYFSSNRDGGKGRDDIYRYFKLRHVERAPDVKQKEEIDFEIVLDFRVYRKQYEDPNDPGSRVLMRVPLPEARIKVTENDVIQVETDADRYGMMTVKLKPDNKYKFFVSSDGYFNNETSFNTMDFRIDSSKYIQRVEVQILLEKIFTNKEVVLENIYYDYDKWDIRADAEPTLDELSAMLELNPNIRIQLSSHTDCRGENAYNQDLSQKRAASAVNYLIQKGIDQDRLTPLGYGENVPAVDCNCDDCSEDQHQANRRTTFKVLE